MSASIKVRINAADILSGPRGPWTKALGSIEGVDEFDAIEVFNIDLDEAKAIKDSLPVLKERGQMLTCSAEFRTEEREETFVSKQSGEQVTKQVLRLYLASTPDFQVEDRPTYKGNLADVLAGISPSTAGQPV
jgi:hypothetical protein